MTSFGPGRARLGALALLITAAAFTSGCHITNHDFANEVRMEPIAIDDLRTALDAQDESEGSHGDSGLLDAAWLPFLYMNIDMFAKTDHEDEPIQPEGFVRLDMRSMLPLFSMWRAGTTFYDDMGEPYEHRFQRSFLWGLWKKEYTRVSTTKGIRHEEETRFLWLLHWGPDIYYEKDDGVSLLD